MIGRGEGPGGGGHGASSIFDGGVRHMACAEISDQNLAKCKASEPFSLLLALWVWGREGSEKPSLSECGYGK